MKRNSVRTVSGVALAVSVGLVLTGCSGVQTNFAEGFSATAAIAQIPAPEPGTTYRVFGSDITGALKASGLSTDDKSWMSALAGIADQSGSFAPVYVDYPMSFASGDVVPLDWHLADVDRLVTYSSLPTLFTVGVGAGFTVPKTFTDLGDGIRTDADAADFTVKPGASDLIDKLGRPTRIAQQGDLFALTTSTDAARSWLDKSETLAKDDSAAAIAKALDAQGVVSFAISQPAKFTGELLVGPDASPEAAAAALKKFDALVPPAPYDLAGVGWAVTDNKPTWVIAYHFDSADDAKDGAQVLRAVWEKGSSLSTGKRISDIATFTSATVSDSTVTIKLEPAATTSPSALYLLFSGREVVFASR